MPSLQKITNFWTKSLRNRWLLGVVVFQALMLAIVGSLQIESQHSFLKEISITQDQGLALSLAISSQSGIDADEAETLDIAVAAQSHFPNMETAMVVSKSGEILAHSEKEFVGTFIEDEISKYFLESGAEVQVLLNTDQIVDIAAPIMLRNLHLGWARVSVSRGMMARNILAMKREGGIFLLGAIILTALYSFFLTLRPTKILRQMVKTAEGFRGGNKDLRIRNVSSDELGTLAKSINSLADTVNHREAELFHQREHLEEVVLERTRDLVKEVRERQSAEEHIKLVLNSALEGIITTDPQGNILNYNPAAERIFGYSETEILGRNVKLLMPDSVATMHDYFLASYVNGNAPKVVGVGGREVIAKRKNGDEFFMEISISELKNNNTHFFTGIVRDITERKEANQKLRDTLETLQVTQKELVQSEKMASLGGLVAGVAHEINTPIGVGVTAASHLQEKTVALKQDFESGLLKKADFKKYVDAATLSTDIISTNLLRASDLIKSFKQVAVDQSSEEPRVFNFLNYIEEILISLHPKLKQTKLSIVADGDKDLSIESLPGTFAQIITNLVMNSLIHAFEPQEEGCIKIHATAENGNVKMTYSDDGKGMDAETVSKIFDPFFTTKRGTGGSGLGMHILYNQTTQTLGGAVKCRSVLGAGTEFEFTFPLSKEMRK
ncbi:MAG: PAS domain S-box protein [Sneathiella sp.]|nr:PAS domain S-box protein [Sneathiella sp.]